MIKKNEVLIKNTTKEERKKLVDKAIAISTLDCKLPVDEDMKLYEKYINGEIELCEVKKKLIEKYKEF